MHDRSVMAIDPGIPTMPGRSTSGFRRPGKRFLLAPGAKRREVLGESHEGLVRCVPLRTACETDLHMDDSFNKFKIFLSVATCRYSNGRTM